MLKILLFSLPEVIVLLGVAFFLWHRHRGWSSLGSGENEPLADRHICQLPMPMRFDYWTIDVEQILGDIR